MLRNKTSGRAGRRGRSGRSGAINMEYVFAGGLILLIVAALGLTFWHVFIGDTPPPPPMGPVHFRCQKCAHQYIKDRDDLTKAQMMQEGEPSGIIDDCPKCKTQRQAIQLTKCPKCEEYYLPKWREDPRLWGREGGNVCEHCGIDADKWSPDQG